MVQQRDIRWRRLKETCSALESRPLSRGLLQACVRLLRLRLRAGRGLARLLPGKPESLPDKLHGLDLSRGQRLLIIAEDRIPQCYRYRVQQKIEQLNQAQVEAKAVAWTEAVYRPQLARYYHTVIFYRVPGYPQVLELIRDIRRMGKLVFYETDDIIFDADIQRDIIESSHRQISRKLQKQVLDGARYYRAAMQACAYGIASTPALAEQMEKHLGEGRVLVHPNGLDRLSERVADKPPVAAKRSEVRLFYGSGTRTHDADLALIAPALADAMKQFPQTRLVLAGHVSLPQPLESYQDRVERLPLLDAENYLDALRFADINLAPLVAGVFADSKSEIKWLEAALVQVPTVASNTRSFREAITHGKTGLLASGLDEWSDSLVSLVRDEPMRRRIGEAARQAALVKYRQADLGKALVRKMRKIAADAGARVDEAGIALCLIGADAASLKSLDSQWWQAYALFQPGPEDVVGHLREYLRYISPRGVLIAGLVSDTVAAELKQSGIPLLILLQDADWLAGGQVDLAAYSELATQDPVKLAAATPNLDAALTARRRLADLSRHATAVVCMNEKLAAVYRDAGLSCDLVTAKKLASMLESGDKAP